MRWKPTLAVLVVLGVACIASSLAAQEQVFRINNMVEPESLDPGVVTG